MTTNITQEKPKRIILDSFVPANNEQIVCIEDIPTQNYKIFAVYVNGEYDRRINVKRS